jgi:hypothetical protein
VKRRVAWMAALAFTLMIAAVALVAASVVTDEKDLRDLAYVAGLVAIAAATLSLRE